MSKQFISTTLVKGRKPRFIFKTERKDSHSAVHTLGRSRLTT